MFAVNRPSLLKSTDPKLFLRECAKHYRGPTCQFAKNLLTKCSSQLNCLAFYEFIVRSKKVLLILVAAVVPFFHKLICFLLSTTYLLFLFFF